VVFSLFSFFLFDCRDRHGNTYTYTAVYTTLVLLPPYIIRSVNVEALARPKRLHTHAHALLNVVHRDTARARTFKLDCSENWLFRDYFFAATTYLLVCVYTFAYRNEHTWKRPRTKNETLTTLII